MTEGNVTPDRAGGQRPPLPERFSVFVGAACGRPPHRYGTTLFVGRDIVLAKSASLCFRLTAKTRSAPLLVLSPRDPLRWARAGPLICAPNHAATPTAQAAER